MAPSEAESEERISQPALEIQNMSKLLFENFRKNVIFCHP